MGRSRRYLTKGWRAGGKMPGCYGHNYEVGNHYCVQCKIARQCKALTFEHFEAMCPQAAQDTRTFEEKLIARIRAKIASRWGSLEDLC